MHSCLYEGWVRHRRYGAVSHRFRYRLFMVYLDLSEIDRVFRGRWMWSATRPALAWFRRADHFGDPRTGLDAAVRDLVERETGRRPAGPIRVLTHLRYGGFVFNPVSFFYCFDRRGDHAEAIVADVSNTPWGERHQYVLARPVRTAAGHGAQYSLKKRFHVSPFQPMDVDYDWRFAEPGERLTVHMTSRSNGGLLFDATLSLGRRPITTRTLASALVRHPLMTLLVITAIYWQAFRLWSKRAAFHPHPRHGAAPEVSS